MEGEGGRVVGEGNACQRREVSVLDSTKSSMALIFCPSSTPSTPKAGNIGLDKIRTGSPLPVLKGKQTLQSALATTVEIDLGDF